MSKDKVTVTTEHKDFTEGYSMGINTLEKLTEKVDEDEVEYEPLLLLGILTVLIECAYRSMPDDQVDELVEIAQDLAESAADEPMNHLH